MSRRLWAPAAAMAVIALASPSGATDAGEVLRQEKYRFCHEERYPLFPDERAWCPLVGEPSEKCPALPKACEAKVDPKSRFSWSGGFGQGQDGGGKDGTRTAPSDDDTREAARKKKEWRFDLPEGLSGLAQILFFVLLGLGVVALVHVIFKNMRRDRVEDDELPPEAETLGDEAATAVNRIVETDVDRLLARARQAAAAGDYEGAMEAAYAALLRRLEGDGLIDMHESRTNGDYVRALRDHPEMAYRVREVVRDVERVQFGAKQASSTLFESLLARILPLVGRAAGLVLLLLGASVLTGCPQPSGDGAGDAGARGGTSPSGTRGVLELLERNGIEVAYRLDPIRKIDEETGVLIIMPAGREELEDYEKALKWVKQGGTLVLAGALPPSELMDISWVPDPGAEAQLVPGGDYGYLLGGLEMQAPIDTALKNHDARFDTEALLTRDPWASSGAHYALYAPYGEGELLLFAEADLFTNIALASGDNADLLVRLLNYRGKVEISDPLTGAGSQSPLQAVHRARLTPVVAQLLLLLLLFILYKGTAFGKPRDPPEHTRRSFADHVRALGTQYARAGASAHALGAYAGWALERLRERVPRGRGRSLDELAGELAARSGQSPEEVSEVLHRAQAASDRAAPASYRPASLRGADLVYQDATNSRQRVALMRELGQLLRSVGG